MAFTCRGREGRRRSTIGLIEEIGSIEMIGRKGLKGAGEEGEKGLMIRRKNRRILALLDAPDKSQEKSQRFSQPAPVVCKTEETTGMTAMKMNSPKEPDSQSKTCTPTRRTPNPA